MPVVTPKMEAMRIFRFILILRIGSDVTPYGVGGYVKIFRPAGLSPLVATTYVKFYFFSHLDWIHLTYTADML